MSTAKWWIFCWRGQKKDWTCHLKRHTCKCWKLLLAQDERLCRIIWELFSQAHWFLMHCKRWDWILTSVLRSLVLQILLHSQEFCSHERLMCKSSVHMKNWFALARFNRCVFGRELCLLLSHKYKYLLETADNVFVLHFDVGEFTWMMYAVQRWWLHICSSCHDRLIEWGSDSVVSWWVLIEPLRLLYWTTTYRLHVTHLYTTL